MRKNLQSKKKYIQNTKRRTMKRSKRRTVKRSKRRTMKRSKRRTMKRIIKRKDGMKHAEIEIPEIINREKNIENKSELIHRFLYENVGTPSHSRKFTTEDIKKFATIWENVFNEYKILDDKLFNKLYTYIIRHKEFEAEEELFPTDYPSPLKEKFEVGDKVFIKGSSTDNVYIILEINNDFTANIGVFPYLPFITKKILGIPLTSLEKTSTIYGGFLGLGGTRYGGL